MREAYARGCFNSPMHGVEATAGVEIREGDDVDEMTNSARRWCATAVGIWGGHHTEVVAYIESAIMSDCPGRAYFVETEEDGKGVQVYDPRDFVKERCACTMAGHK